jgi:hypothetical protein
MSETIDGHQRLVAACIAQAVGDYRKMEARGWIKDGQVALPLQPNMGRSMASMKIRGAPAERSSCVELLHFFRPGGAMDQLIDLAQLNISPDAIRRKLRFHCAN